MKNSYSYDQLTEVLKKKAVKLSSLTLNERQLCDLELILNGGFSPLKSFLNKKDYNSVLDNMRLSNGDLWPIPITLDVSNETINSSNLKNGKDIALRDKEGFIIAILTIDDIWK